MNELHLLRYVPGDSTVHRLWAGTKLLVVAAVSIGVVTRPTWGGVAAAAFVLLLAFGLSGVPRSAMPRLPRWFAIGLGIGLVLAITAGPSGVEHWLRFTALGAVVLGMAVVIGWTTPLADLPPALDRIYSPLRIVRVPVDEVVSAVALSARCIPLLLDEMRTLGAARRLRQPAAPKGFRAQVRALHDLLVTALVASIRRARDLAEAIDARGGPSHVGRSPVRLRRADYVALVLGAVALAAIILV